MLTAQSPSKKSLVRNEKGMAIFEMIPIIVVIILLLNFSLGFFGAIHTGILNSIAARNYAFSTFNHRATLTYLRNNPTAEPYIHYEKKNLRLHAVHTEKADDVEWNATTRKIDIFDYKDRAPAVAENSKPVHNQDVNTILETQRNEKTGVNPIWIKTAYGICLNANCGT